MEFQNWFAGGGIRRGKVEGEGAGVEDRGRAGGGVGRIESAEYGVARAGKGEGGAEGVVYLVGLGVWGERRHDIEVPLYMLDQRYGLWLSPRGQVLLRGRRWWDLHGRASFVLAKYSLRSFLFVSHLKSTNLE